MTLVALKRLFSGCLWLMAVCWGRLSSESAAAMMSTVQRIFRYLVNSVALQRLSSGCLWLMAVWRVLLSSEPVANISIRRRRHSTKPGANRMPSGCRMAVSVRRWRHSTELGANALLHRKTVASADSSTHVESVLPSC